MSCDPEGTVSYYSQDKPGKHTPEERKGLLSNFSVGDRRGGKPPSYEDEEHAAPRGRTPPQKKGISCITGGLIALILGVSFLSPMSRIWCGGMGSGGQSTGPSGLLSNGTHEFKRTVLIVSLDGLR